MKNLKKTLALVLAFAMILTCVPFAGVVAFAEDASTESATTTTVIAFSDFQYPNTDVYNLGATGNEGGKILLNSLFSASGVTSADGLLCAGDYDYDLNRSASDTSSGIDAIKEVVGTKVPEDGMIWVQGNHDPTSTLGGTSESGNNDPASGAYGVFVINERDYMWNSTGMSEDTVKATAENLRRYFNSKIASGYTAPIFVISHLPLHYSMRTNNDGDKMYANYIFDVLNEAGEYGLNIFYLYGHDHSNGWDDYLGGSKVYLAKGSSINIAQASKTVYETETLNFTYVNAGYTGYYENHNTATGTQDTSYDISDMTMTKFVISDENVIVTRYNTSGETDLKKAGVLNWYKSENNKDYSADTSVVTSSQTVTLTSVTDKEHEIDPVVPVVTSSDTSGESLLTATYTAVSSDSLVDGKNYLIVAKRDSTYYAAATQYTGLSGYTTSRLESVIVNPSDALNAGSLITKTTGTAVGGGTLSIRACEWTYTDGRLTPAYGENAGKYIHIPRSNSGSITFNDTASTYTVGSTFREGSLGYLNLRSNYTYSSYTSGTTLTYFEKTENAPVYLHQTVSESGQPVPDGKYVIYNSTRGSVVTGTASSTSGHILGYNGSDISLSDDVLTSPEAYEYTFRYDSDSGYYYITNRSGQYLSVSSSNGSVTFTSTATLTNVYAVSDSAVAIGNTSESCWIDFYGKTDISSWSESTPNNNETQKLYRREECSDYYLTTVEDGSQPIVDGTYIIYNPTRKSAVTGTASSTSGHILGCNDSDIKVNGYTLTSREAFEYTFTYDSASGNYYVINKDGEYLSVAAKNGNITFTSTPTLTRVYKVSDTTVAIGNSGSNYWIDFYKTEDISSYWGSTPNNNEIQQLYRKTVPSGELVLADTQTYLLLESYETFNLDNDLTAEDTEEILRNGNSSNQPISILSSDNELGTGATVFDAANSTALSFDFSFVDFSKAGTYIVNVYYTGANGRVQLGSVQVSVSADKAIVSAELLSNSGSVYEGAGGSAYTGAYIHVEYEGGSEADIPVTVGMLLDYTGNKNAVSFAKKAGTYAGLGVFYEKGNGYWFSDFTLNVTQRDDYPEYPDEGSVKVNKTGSGIDFQTTGVAQIELTATGVPKNPGIDIVLMVDTSSSMDNATGEYTDADGNTVEIFADDGGNWYDFDGNTVSVSSSEIENKSKRIVHLQSAVTDLLEQLSTPNSTTGVVPDIQMAIADFNGYGAYEEGDTESYSFIDKNNDHPSGTTCRDGDKIGSVLTGTGDLTVGAFEDIKSLNESFDASEKITPKSGTNYDFAFEYVYDLIAAKKAENEANQDDREIVVIFMSDGAPFKYNYFSAYSDSTLWNNWIQGTYESYTDVESDSSHKYFYNGPGNSHRTADAIKGDPGTDYVVIDKMCPEGTVDVTGDGVADPYMTTVKGLGATMYSIGFCLTIDGNITLGSMNYVLENIASDSDKYYIANSGTQLSDAFTDIGAQTVQAGTDGYFIDTMGPAYDLQLRKNYTVGDEEKTLSFDPEIVVTNYKVYTRADYNKGIIDDLDQIGTRVSTATPEILETVTFNADGTEAYSDQIDGGATNILVNNVINAETFIYNNNKDKSVLIDRDGDGVEEYTLAAETFCWKIGIIADTEYALSYYVYLTGSMEGERDAGSYATNTSAVLYYKNYLGNDCHKDTVSPILPWQAATVNYEFYLVNANGQPVNSSGTVVPFENRVKIGLTQSKTILLNSSGGDTAYTLRAASEIPEGYNLFNDDAEYYIFVGSGSNASRATITDTADIVTTYYYEANYKEKVNGDVSQLTDPGNTHVAFAVLYETTAVPDTVVVDFGLPTAVHALANDIAIPAATEVNAIGTALTDGTQTGATAYAESRLTSAVTSISADRYTATVDGRNVKVQLSDMLLDNAVTFYYEVKIGSNYYYSTITVIPAQNIYYEEDFITFTDANVLVTGKTETLKWSDAGTAVTDALQDEDRPGNFAASNDANNPYGSDTAYNSEEIIYSMGNAKVATVCAGSFTADKVAEAGSSKEPYATFNFVGTGFDLISATTAECGCAWVKVTNNTTNTSKTYIINTYYGYSYGRAYRNAEGKTTLRASYTDENGNVVYNAPLYDCIDADAMQPVPTYHDVTDGKACDTVSYYATNSTDTYPVYTLIPTYYDENGNITTTVTDEPAYAYAYAYSWMPTEDASDALYQVPVVCIEGLDYGNYTVKITPKYAKSFDVNGAGEYKFYIDGVRIYDPCGTAETIADSKETVNKAYYDDNEANAQYFELRDNIINANDLFVSGDGESTNYGIYIDGFTSLNRGSTTSDTDAMDKYKEAGPNNEVYLSSGQAIAFNMEVTSTAEPASVQIGAKVVKAGADGKADGKLVISNSGMDEAGEISVLGCTAMYRDITPYLEWDSDYLEAHENTYKTLYPVVIINNSDCIISLTNIKYSLGNSKFTEPDELAPEGTNSPMLLTSSAAVKDFAVTAVQKYTYTAPDEIDTADITAEWNSDNFAIGAEAVLTITTPDNVEKVQIGNEIITEYTEGENGTRVWTYKVIVTENTDGNYTVTFTDALGRVSDAVTTDPITVEAPELPETEETADETSEEKESVITIIMKELLNSIIDALKSLFGFLTV